MLFCFGLGMPSLARELSGVACLCPSPTLVLQAYADRTGLKKNNDDEAILICTQAPELVG